MIKTSPTNQCLNPHLPKYPSDVLYFIDKIFIFSCRFDKVMIKGINIAMLGSRFVYDFEIKLAL
jgi:hypothetical protein